MEDGGFVQSAGFSSPIRRYPVQMDRPITKAAGMKYVSLRPAVFGLRFPFLRFLSSLSGVLLVNFNLDPVKGGVQESDTALIRAFACVAHMA